MSAPRAWAAATGAIAHAFADRLDDEIAVDGRDGHHLQRVRRLRPGEHVTVADGTGRWRSYEVAAAEAGRLVLAATGEVHVEPDPPVAIHVALALTKGGLDDVAARVTELGVRRIEPFRARRSVVRWDAARAEGAVAKLRVVVREAAAQCRRATVPEVAPVVDLATLVADRPGLLLAARGGAPSPRAVPPGGTWTVIVGPEGGFDPDELTAFASVPRLGVGHHVLRASTAPVAVCAVLAAAASGPWPHG